MAKDLQKLKEANRIEDLIEEDGYRLDHKPDQRYWYCLQEPDLNVDVQKQRYYWKSRNESGDVINWLVNRFGWTVRKAISYLSNRLEISKDLRPKFPAKEQAEPEEVIAKSGISSRPVKVAIDPELARDKRILKIHRLAFDFPGGIEKILNLSFMEIIEEQNRIPKLFLELSGQIDEVSEYCDFCFQELTGWKNGGVFWAIKLDGNYAIVHSEFAGVYCRQCVSNFKRWMEALDLLAQVKGERWMRRTENESEAGRGENHTA